MAQIFLFNTEKAKAEWVPIDDPVRNSNGDLTAFGIQMPQWALVPGYHHLHLVHQSHRLSDVAVSIFEASTRVNSARSLLQIMERTARERKWYDPEMFPSMERHIGKAGVLIGSAIQLHKFLKTRPFDRAGYYNGKQVLILKGEPINVGSPQDYRPG